MFKIFFWSKIATTHSWASIKDVQATGEAFSPQKRTSSTSKDKIFNGFLLSWAIFALLDPDCESGSGSRNPIDSVSNPDPQHCSGIILVRSLTFG
jgi:hypothetical protein